MGTIKDKFDVLRATKSSIKQAIIDKGQEVSDNDTFSSYSAKIAAIRTESPIDNDTITKNVSDQLQASGLIETNEGNTLKLWSGSKEEWLGTPDTWYAYKGSVQFGVQQSQYRPMDYSTYTQGDPVYFGYCLGKGYYNSTPVYVFQGSNGLSTATANVSNNNSSISTFYNTGKSPANGTLYNSQGCIFRNNNGTWLYNQHGLLNADEPNLRFPLSKLSFTQTLPSGSYDYVYDVNITNVFIDVSSYASSQYTLNYARMTTINSEPTIITDKFSARRNGSDSNWEVNANTYIGFEEEINYIYPRGELASITVYNPDYTSTNYIYATCNINNDYDTYKLIRTSDGHTWEYVKDLSYYIVNGTISSMILVNGDSEHFGYYTSDFNTFSPIDNPFEDDDSKLGDYKLCWFNSTHFIGMRSIYVYEDNKQYYKYAYIWCNQNQRNVWYGYKSDNMSNSIYMTQCSELTIAQPTSSSSYYNYKPLIMGGSYYQTFTYSSKCGPLMYIHSDDPHQGDQIYSRPNVPETGITISSVDNYGYGSIYVYTTASGNYTSDSNNNINLYTTISDTHPEYACLIDNEMLVVGDAVISNNSKAGTGIEQDDSGVISVKDYTKFLKNNSTISNSLSLMNDNNTSSTIAIGPNIIADSFDGVLIGRNITANGQNSVVIGNNDGYNGNGTKAGGYGSVVIGSGAQTAGSESIAIGIGAKTTNSSYNNIQLGRGSNSTSNSLQVGNYSLLNLSTGSIPSDRLSTFTGSNGTTAGTKGIVPAPAATDNNKFLKGNGTWAEVSGVKIDNSTITKNASDQLQVSGILNPNTNTGIKIWEGSESDWENGETSDWFGWSNNSLSSQIDENRLPSTMTTGYSRMVYGTSRLLCLTGSSIFYSDDEGLTWVAGSNAPNQQITTLIFHKGNFVASDRYGAIYTCAELSDTWVSHGYVVSSSYYLTGNEIATTNNKLFCIMYNNDTIALYESSDIGATWTEVVSDVVDTALGSAYTNRIHIGSNGSTVIITAGTQSIYSVDDGVTWQQGGQIDATYQGWLIGPMNSGMFVVANQKTIKYTEDNGITWKTGASFPGTNAVSVLKDLGGTIIVSDGHSFYSGNSSLNNFTSIKTLTSNQLCRYLTVINNKLAGCIEQTYNMLTFTSDTSVIYTDSTTVSSSSTVYSAPKVVSSDYSINYKSGNTLNVYDSVKQKQVNFNRDNQYDQTTTSSIGDLHSDWLCNIEGVGVKIGNTLIADIAGIVDQTYDPTSINAQSGLAVKSAIDAALGDVETLINAL